MVGRREKEKKKTEIKEMKNKMEGNVINPDMKSG